MTTEKRRFNATGTGGRLVVIVEMQHWVTFAPLSGPKEHKPGTTELFTSTGEDVTLNRDGTFTIVLTDEVLHAVV